MKLILVLMLLLAGVSQAQCLVTCTRLEGPDGQVEHYWYDKTPGQCGNEESCVSGCDGSCSPFCLEEELGKSKPGLCVTIPSAEGN